MGARHEWGVRPERAVESSKLVVAFSWRPFFQLVGAGLCGRDAGLCRTGGFEDRVGGGWGGEDWAFISGVPDAGE